MTFPAATSLHYAGNRVDLMDGADFPDDEGAKESLWRLHELDIDVCLAWSRQEFAGKYADRQPKNLSADEWQSLAGEIADPAQAVVVRKQTTAKGDADDSFASG